LKKQSSNKNSSFYGFRRVLAPKVAPSLQEGSYEVIDGVSHPRDTLEPSTNIFSKKKKEEIKINVDQSKLSASSPDLSKKITLSFSTTPDGPEVIDGVSHPQSVSRKIK